MILRYACSKELCNPILWVWGPQRCFFLVWGRQPHWFERCHSRKLVRSLSHLCTQPVEYGQRCFLRTRRQIPRGTHAGRAALLTLACGNKLARLLHQ